MGKFSLNTLALFLFSSAEKEPIINRNMIQSTL